MDALPRPLLVSALVATFPAVQMGVAIGALNPVAEVIAEALGVSLVLPLGFPLVVSVFCPTGFLGTQCTVARLTQLSGGEGGGGGGSGGGGGPAAAINVLGVVCLASGVVASGAALVAPSSPSLAFLLLLLSRSLVGFASGAGSVVVPSYLNDIAPLESRGVVGSFFQLGVVMGIFGAQCLALPFTSPAGWGWLVGVLPALLGIAQLWLARKHLAESPAWLESEERDNEAAWARLRLGLPTKEEEAATAAAAAAAAAAAEVELVERGEEDERSAGGMLGAAAGMGGGEDTENGEAADAPLLDDDDDDDDVAAAAAAAAGGGGGGGGSRRPPLGLQALLRNDRFRFPFFLVAGVLVAQQLSGINAVFFYSTALFSASGVEDPVFATLLASGVNALSTVAVIPLIETAGRRPLLLWGCGGMAASALALCAAISLGLPGGWAVTAVLAFIVFFELGLGAVPWILGGEVFPAEAKDAALSAASALNWGANFAVGLLFPAVQEYLGPFSFLPFAACLAATYLVVYAYLPETKNRSPREVLDRIHANKVTAHAALRRLKGRSSPPSSFNVGGGVGLGGSKEQKGRS